MRGIDMGLARGGREAVVVAVTVAVALALLAVPSARATTVSQDITSSAGPLTNIWLGNDLDCQVQYTGETAYEFFPTDSAPGRLRHVRLGHRPLSGHRADSVRAGPQPPIPDGARPRGTSTRHPYNSGSQSSVTGSGTTAEPVLGDDRGHGRHQRADRRRDRQLRHRRYRLPDRHHASQYREHHALGRLYHAADCYLQATGGGYGEFNPSTSAVACTQSANNSPPGLVEEFAPLTDGQPLRRGRIQQRLGRRRHPERSPRHVRLHRQDRGTAEDNGAGRQLGLQRSRSAGRRRSRC